MRKRTRPFDEDPNFRKRHVLESDVRSSLSGLCLNPPPKKLEPEPVPIEDITMESRWRDVIVIEDLEREIREVEAEETETGLLKVRIPDSVLLGSVKER